MILSAEKLGILGKERDALIETLALLETNKMQHVPEDWVAEANLGAWVPNFEDMIFSGHFNMSCWTNGHKCGTVACIGGTAELLGKFRFTTESSDVLHHLFHPGCEMEWEEITPAMAAKALRSFLETGLADWVAITNEGE